MSTIASPVSPLITIEALTKKYADARAIVSERVNALEDEVRSVHRRKVPGIKTAVAAAKDAQAELVAAVQAAPELFVKPRSYTLNGIKVGYAQGKGSLDWEDDEMVVARIERFFPREADVLIATKQKPVIEALKQLDAKDLAKLGVTFQGAGDYVFVKASDSAVDKLVKKILKEGAVEEADAS